MYLVSMQLKSSLRVPREMLHFHSEAQKSKAVLLFQPEGEFAASSGFRRRVKLQGVLLAAIERPLTWCEVEVLAADQTLSLIHSKALS